MPEVVISRTARWSVAAEVRIDRTASWDVRQAVQINRTVLFNVNAIQYPVVITRTASWRVYTGLAIARTASWQVDSSAVSADFAPATNPFNRVEVTFSATGGSALAWELNHHFVDELPYVFQVQSSETGLAESGDWVGVGSAVTNAFTTTVTSNTWTGKTPTMHFRIRLATGSNKVYYSEPVAAFGRLDWRSWHIGQEILRKETLRHVHFTSVDGYLLKQRRAGPPCTRCLDPRTSEVTDSHCGVCYGTGFVDGYYAPLAAAYADISLEQKQERRDLNAVGHAKQTSLTGRFLGGPQIYAQDIWVNKHADQRYNIQPVKVEAHMRGVPIVVTVELRLLPPDDVVYQLGVTG